MLETSSYLKEDLATLCRQEMGSFDASNECQSYLPSQKKQILKNIVLSPIYGN